MPTAYVPKRRHFFLPWPCILIFGQNGTIIDPLLAVNDGRQGLAKSTFSLTAPPCHVRSGFEFEKTDFVCVGLCAGHYARRDTDAQKAFIIKQGEDGTSVAEICRKAGISQAIYFNWKKKYSGMMPSDMKRLRELEQENAQSTPGGAAVWGERIPMDNERRARPTMRCAVYTGKSSEEGLEQSFNSLHAQREACEAYIGSQKHEGWKVLPAAYDDGGFSGGTMERPALQSLLSDIRKGLVDVVVVYKIDRLTRSLFDFAKIVEIFDAANVSFVSVTQSFNTTTSMGRLTLNVLLSFAQSKGPGDRVHRRSCPPRKRQSRLDQQSACPCIPCSRHHGSRPQWYAASHAHPRSPGRDRQHLIRLVASAAGVSRRLNPNDRGIDSDRTTPPGYFPCQLSLNGTLQVR
jgi:DNA invertase Pin-like site-specific DNA recombinase